MVAAGDCCRFPSGVGWARPDRFEMETQRIPDAMRTMQPRVTGERCHFI
jgi:hypothetical protein